MSHNWHNGNAAFRSGAPRGDNTPFGGNSLPRFDGSNYYTVGSSPGDYVNETVDHLKSFFGEPNPLAMAQYKTSKSFYQSEKQDYPEAFSKFFGNNGQGEQGVMSPNGHLSKTIIEKCKASENWQLTRMAPWTLHTGSLDFTWEETKWTRGMLDRSPEESLPRLQTHTRTSGYASMVRYGTCLLLESTFASTPEGRRTYLNNLEQIRIATVETCSYGVIISILEHEPYLNPYDKPFATYLRRGKHELDSYFKNECEQFCIINKDRSGYDIVKNNLRRRLNERNQTGDFTVVPAGVGTYIHNSSDAKFYLDGQSRSTRISDLPMNSQTVVESRSFSEGENSDVVDPFFRNHTIGGFSTFDDSHLGNVENDKYRTSMQDAFGYNEDADSLYMFRFIDMYKYSGVWNHNEPNDPITDGIGRLFMYDCGVYTWGHACLKFANDYNQIIDSIHALPEDKQAKIASSLMRLPEGDNRADPNTPFNQQRFDEMTTLTGWDKQYTVGQRQEFKRLQEDGYTMATRGANLEQFERDSEQAARKKARSNNGAYMTSEALWEANGPELDQDAMIDIGFDQAATSSAQSRPVRFRGSDGNDYVGVRENPPIRVKRVNRANPSFANKYEANNIANTIKNMCDDIVRMAGAPAAFFDLGKPVWQSMDEARREFTDNQLIVVDYVKRIVKYEHANDSHKQVLLSELKHQLAYLLKKTYEDKPSDLPGGRRFAIATDNKPTFLDQLQAKMAVIASSLETRIALNGIPTGEKTPLEEKKVKNEFDLDATLESDEIKKHGWWDVSGSGLNGQIRLMVDGTAHENEYTLPIPHDAFAATLTHNHSVLFALPTDNFDIDDYRTKELTDGKPNGNLSNEITLAGKIGGSPHTLRYDSLAYSIILSMINGGYIEKGVGYTFESSLNKSLKRVIKKNQQTLLCQTYMQPRIKATEEILKEIITNEQFRIVNEPKQPLTANINGVSPDDNASIVKAFLELMNASTIVEVVGGVKFTYAELVFDAMDQPFDEILKQNNYEELIDTAMEFFIAKGNVNMQLYFEANVTEDDIIRIYGNRNDLEARRGAIIEALAKGCFEVYDSKRGVAIKPKAAATRVPSGPIPFPWKNRDQIIRDLNHASVVSGSFYRACLENNIRVPFGLRTWRPFKTYNTACLLHMKAGANGAAKTFYQMPNFMMADNAAQKLIFGHFTMYNKTVVFYPEMIAIQKHVWSNDYLGGCGVRLWNPLDEAHLNALRDQNYIADIFVTLVPQNKTQSEQLFWRSMTGRMPDSLSVEADINTLVDYEGARGLTHMWHFRTNGVNYGQTNFGAYRAGEDTKLQRACNVICMQEFQLKFNPSNSHYDLHTEEKGHWGSNVYAGCGQVRAGRKQGFEIPRWNSINSITLN